MNTTERRTTTRLLLRIPLRFRPITNPASPEQRAESLNISQRGVYFATEFPPQAGTPVELLLKMPSELTGKTPAEIRCTARVVHVEPNTFVDGRAGVGVEIERYGPPIGVERRTGRHASDV